MKISSIYHTPNPKVIIGLTFLGAFIYHQYTHGIRDYFNNGFYIFGDPDIDFLFDVGWWPKYFIYPFIIALMWGYRVRLYQITVTDIKDSDQLFQKIIKELSEGTGKLEILRMEDKFALLWPKIRTFSGILLSTDRVRVNCHPEQIEIVGRKKYVTEIEYSLARMVLSDQNNKSSRKKIKTS